MFDHLDDLAQALREAGDCPSTGWELTREAFWLQMAESCLKTPKTPKSCPQRGGRSKSPLKLNIPVPATKQRRLTILDIGSVTDRLDKLEGHRSPGALSKCSTVSGQSPATAYDLECISVLATPKTKKSAGKRVRLVEPEQVRVRVTDRTPRSLSPRPRRGSRVSAAQSTDRSSSKNTRLCV